ncbi:MAG: hypothetical protein ABIY37_08590 [Devosia sp.]
MLEAVRDYLLLVKGKPYLRVVSKDDWQKWGPSTISVSARDCSIIWILASDRPEIRQSLATWTKVRR